MAIVYQHIRKDTNQIFYIGIGKTIARSNSKKNRNKYWNHIVDKVGYIIEILHNNITWDEACNYEKQYILKYGRKDLNTGSLVNLTNGGDGVFGLIMSEERKKQLSDGLMGEKNHNYGKKFSDETRYKLSISHKGENHVNYGKKLKKETREKMSLKQIGENNSFNVLSEKDVISIRNEYSIGGISQSKLGKKYGCSRGNIYDIIHRNSWKHI
jgi:hypothetical protein